MNIGFFTDGYTPQLHGVAINTEAVKAALEGQGHRVSIFAPKMDGFVDRGPGIHRFPSVRVMIDPPHWLATPVSRRLPEILHLGLDVVHVHSPFSMLALGWQVARFGHLPLVSTYHTLFPAHMHEALIFGHALSPRLAEWYSARTCNLCDQVIAPSEKIQQLLYKFGVRKPIRLIRNGIQVGRFQDRPHGFIRSAWGLGGEAKIMLSAGRLTPGKNFGFLIDMLEKAVARDENVCLVLVGQGPCRAEFEEHAARLGVRKNLILTGPIAPEQMPDVYADADLFVNASFSETFSMTTLEAIAAGLPCVVVRDHALQVLVADGENGFVVSPEPEVFAARALEILDNPDERKRMSACARARSRDFTIEAQAQNLVKLYVDLIEESEPQKPLVKSNRSG